MKFEKTILKNQTSFDLKDIFECGQCFRWKKEIDGSYTGIVKIGILNVSKSKTDITIKGYIDDKENLKSFCKDYFDLNEDYLKIQKIISKNDKVMKEAIKFGNGIRILNQDSWEMLISFIISAANNIPRISKCINNISKEYGKKIVIPDDVKKKLFSFENNENEYYLFPSPKQLIKSNENDLRKCNLGFRDKYVYNATQIVFNGEIDLNRVQQKDYYDAKKELVKLAGVGSKVADCILLFSMHKKEAFPVDTWIKKIMNEVYVDSKDVKKINKYAEEKWGEYAGIAQQYLFYYKREN